MDRLPPGGARARHWRCDIRAAKGKIPMLDNVQRTLLGAPP
jgi:hypothetical protein